MAGLSPDATATQVRAARRTVYHRAMPMTILLSGATAVFFGFSDFFGGVAARRDSEFTVTATAHILGLALLAVAALAFPAVSVAPRTIRV